MVHILIAHMFDWLNLLGYCPPVSSSALLLGADVSAWLDGLLIAAEGGFLIQLPGVVFPMSYGQLGFAYLLDLLCKQQIWVAWE